MSPSARRRSAALLLLLAVGCERSEPAAPDVVARIEGEEIRYAQIERYVERTAGDGESVLVSDVLSQLFDQYLDEELLLRLAADRGLIQRGPEASAASRRRAIDALLAEESESGAESGSETGPDEREVVAYYEAHRAELTRPERVRLRQILTEDRATAERALRELAGGADFAQVARTLSDGPGAASGGYQGELSRADLPPAFADVIFSLRPGEVSRLIPADYGFHIFQVVARSPAGVIPLAEARPEIEERLRQQRTDRHLAELVEEARRRYNVEVHARNLPFEYRGSYERDAKNP